MAILRALKEETILPSLNALTKEGVLLELADLLAFQFPFLDKQAVFKTLMERERLGSTGIGEGIAIPHGKMKGQNEMFVCFAKSSDGVQFESIDGRPAHLFFLLLAPEEAAEPYLRVLGQITRFLKRGDIRAKLMKATSAPEIMTIFTETGLTQT